MVTEAYRNLKDVAKSKRSVGEIYLDCHLRPGIWDGKKLRCPHNQRRSSCFECLKCSVVYQHEHPESKNNNNTECATLCEHKRVQADCRDCDLEELSICKHQRKRSQCPECTDPALLDSSNIKDGGPRDSVTCKHNPQRRECNECSSSSICEHKLQTALCKDCSESHTDEYTNLALSDGSSPSRWSALDDGGITAMLEFDKCKDLLQFYEVPTVESFDASKLSGKLES